MIILCIIGYWICSVAALTLAYRMEVVEKEPSKRWKDVFVSLLWPVFIPLALWRIAWTTHNAIARKLSAWSRRVVK